MTRTLRKSSIRYQLRHPWQFWLSVLGIALGVAIVVSIDIANLSTSKAFDLSLNAVTGKATHTIKGSSAGIPDSFYTYLKVEKGIINIAPVIQSYAALDGPVKKVFSIMGFDIFAEKPFRDYLSESTGISESEFKDFLTKPNAAILSEETARSLNLSKGDTIKLLINGKRTGLIISGIIENYSNKESLENLIITDISTAQEVLGRKGVIDGIDLIANSDEEIKKINSILPENYVLQTSSSRSDTAKQMLDAFNVNLTALSLLALIVGLFLIYNSMTFSVVQRKTLLGTLRALGVTKSEIYRIIIIEVLLISITGTVIGFALAILISKNLIAITSRTINDLYFVVSVQEIHLSVYIIVKGFLVGIMASLISALKPAKEASSIQPQIAMIRSDQESGILKRIRLLTISGLVMGIVGAAILVIPSKNVWLSYIGILPVIIAFALFTPGVIVISDKIFSPLLKNLFGITGRIASRGIIQNISRTNAAIAALGIAVAATVGVGTMIHSFRATVVQWLETGLKADIYISAPTIVSNTNDAVLPESLLEELKKNDKLLGQEYYRGLDVWQNGVKFTLIASGASDVKLIGFQIKGGNLEEALERFKKGEVLISEPFAYKHDLNKGSILKLKTDKGFKDFKVAGIYYNYASDQGYVAIEYSNFKKYWNSSGLSGISVFVKNPDDIQQVKESIQSLAGENLLLNIRTNKFLRESSIEIFDRTFLIAKVLQLLAVIVAFIGILSSLMSLQLERRRELGILRAIGLLPSQLFKIVTIQSTLIGLIAGVLALPLGNLLAAILVFIINKRSFGWTMQFQVVPSIIIEALLLALLASIIAGIYPGYKMSKTSPAVALREE